MISRHGNDSSMIEDHNVANPSIDYGNDQASIQSEEKASAL